MGYLGSTWVEGFWFGWFHVVNWDFVVGVQRGRCDSLFRFKIFAMACDLSSIGMIVWVVVLHWVKVCDYSCWHSVYYQEAVFIVFLCGCIFLSVLFITGFVLCVMGQKMLIVISKFACVCKCLFLVTIFNF